MEFSTENPLKEYPTIRYNIVSNERQKQSNLT
jgi:hypothetical protein